MNSGSYTVITYDNIALSQKEIIKIILKIALIHIYSIILQRSEKQLQHILNFRTLITIQINEFKIC